MPYYVVAPPDGRAQRAAQVAVGQSRVLVLGVAYKTDIDDMRESPAIKIAELLLDKGADVVYHDPFVQEFVVAGRRLPSCALNAETVSDADAVLIITAHSGVDYELVARSASLVLDTRNAMSAYPGDNVVRL